MGHHHEIDGRPLAIKRASDRSFGLVIALVLGAIALAPWFTEGSIRLPLLASAAALATLALAIPALLRPFASLWFRLGLLLHRLTSPLILAIVYFAVITPTAVIQRLRGRDLLRLRRDTRARSYWIPRRPEDCRGSSMERQF